MTDQPRSTTATPKRPWTRSAVALTLLIATLVACSGRRMNHRIDRTRPETGRLGYTQRGHASWYGGTFHGRATASGEIYDKNGLTAAHRELPLGTWIDVTHRTNGRTVRVKVNDRGPFIRGRMLDLSRGAAEALGMINEGVAPVRIRVVPAPATVTARVKAAPPARVASYTVQVGAFRDRDGALSLKLALGDRFGPVTIVTHDRWHRVHVGRFDRRTVADGLRDRLLRAGHRATVLAHVEQ